MLDRQKGQIIFECDGCSEVIETETRDFNEALRTLNNESWRAKKIGRDWIHSCASCAEKT